MLSGRLGREELTTQEEIVMSNKVVKYEAQSGGLIELSFQDVKNQLCPLANDKEIGMFLQLCKYQKLNPFLREVYLIKYSSSEKASMVTGKETFTKRAESHKDYDGFKAGVVTVSKAGELAYPICTFGDEKLVGGWAEIHRKDQKIPIRVEVSLKEYEQRKKDGKLNRMWSTKPGTMIRKVAIVQALREAFPGLLGGLYDSSEIPIGETPLSETPIDVTPEAPTAPPDIEAKYKAVIERLEKCHALPEVENTKEKYVRPIWKSLTEAQQKTITATAEEVITNIKDVLTKQAAEKSSDIPPADKKEALGWYKQKINALKAELRKADKAKFTDLWFTGKLHEYVNESYSTIMYAKMTDVDKVLPTFMEILTDELAAATEKVPF